MDKMREAYDKLSTSYLVNLSDFEAGWDACNEFKSEQSRKSSPVISVWYGAMPESNGKTNWTALLCRDGDISTGITIERSEYPDRVRYEADRVRFLIGEISEEPCILDYDADKRSDYVGE